MTAPLHCQAHREGDEMFCGLCALRWDVSDPDPPRCQPIGRSDYAIQPEPLTWEHHQADPTPRPSHYAAPSPWRWSVLVSRRPWVRPRDHYGPSLPARLVLTLRVDGRDCGVLREFQNTSRERGEAWELVRSMNFKRN